MQLRFEEVAAPPHPQPIITPHHHFNNEEKPPTSTPTLPDIWPRLAALYGAAPALVDPHASPPARLSFSQLNDTITAFASGLQALGLTPGDKVSLISENSSRWLIADQAIMKCGAVDAVRGVSSTLEELFYIIQHSESSALVVQDADALRYLVAGQCGTEEVKQQQHALFHSSTSPLRFVIQLWGEVDQSFLKESAAKNMTVLSFDQVLQRIAASSTTTTTTAITTTPHLSVSNETALATLVYTSGTTGHPKGVALTHANILHQIQQFPAFIPVQPGETTLSILPPWHIYERTVSYYILASGASQVYTSIRRFKDDLGVYRPHYLVCVPLVLDTLRSRVLATLKKASFIRRIIAGSLLQVAMACTRAARVINKVDIGHASVAPSPFHLVLTLAWVKATIIRTLLHPLHLLAQALVLTKIKQGLGIQKCVVSGGGSLPPHLDDFFETVGMTVLNGYGLTETSPVLACRSSVGSNVRGTVGRVLPGGTRLRFVHPDTFQDVDDGVQGLILAQGPSVFLGYYRNEEATEKAFYVDRSGDGGKWFITGDLGWKVPSGSATSTTANDDDVAGCLVLTGRAKDTIVLSSGENVEPQPIEDALCSSPYIKFAALIGSGRRSLGALLVVETEALPEDGSASLLKKEIEKACEGRVRWEHVTAWTVVKKPFSVEDGTLTKTMKIRRAAIAEVYKKEIKELEAKLR